MLRARNSITSYEHCYCFALTWLDREPSEGFAAGSKEKSIKRMEASRQDVVFVVVDIGVAW